VHSREGQAFKTAATVWRQDTGQWRSHVFHLPDARFANCEHMGSDFRLWAGGHDDLRVRKVDVRPAP
jgi:hypothetical protein